MKKNTLLMSSLTALALILTLGVSQYTLPVRVGAEDGVSTSNKQVTVTGSGKISAAPDTAVINVGINLTADTAANAQKQNSESTEKLVSLLGEMGITAKDIHTSWYNIYPEYNYSDPSAQPKQTGYRVDHQMTVKVSDLKKVSDILGRVTEVNGITVQGVNYTLENNESFMMEARKLAAADAKEKAGALGEIFEFSVGKLIMVNENSMPGYYPMYSTGMGGADMAANGVNITPQDIEVTVDVTTTFEILN